MKVGERRFPVVPSGSHQFPCAGRGADGLDRGASFLPPVHRIPVVFSKGTDGWGTTAEPAFVGMREDGRLVDCWEPLGTKLHVGQRSTKGKVHRNSRVMDQRRRK